MYCRGEDTRREICKKYEITPFAHVQLLAGQTKKSCTGDDLTNSYYCFHYKSLESTEEGTLLCGEHAAKDFLHLISHPGLPLFNPLLEDREGGDRKNGSSRTQTKKLKWDPVAKQLHDAINLLVVCWSSPPKSALANIKKKLEQYSDRMPFPSQIKGVNTIIGHDLKRRKLSEMLQELSMKNNIKKYNFNLLDEILENENIISNFT